MKLIESVMVLVYEFTLSAKPATMWRNAARNFFESLVSTAAELAGGCTLYMRLQNDWNYLKLTYFTWLIVSSVITWLDPVLPHRLKLQSSTLPSREESCISQAYSLASVEALSDQTQCTSNHLSSLRNQSQSICSCDLDPNCLASCGNWTQAHT